MRRGLDATSMRLRDAFAKRKSHSHPMRLGRIKGIEYFTLIAGLHATPPITESDRDFLFVAPGGNEDFALIGRRLVHRFLGVNQQVDTGLLKLHAVSLDWQQLLGQVKMNLDARSASIVANDFGRLLHHMVDIQQLQLGRLSTSKCTQVADDFCGASDRFGNFFGAVDRRGDSLGVSRFEIPTSRLGKSFCRVQRLMHFVRNAGYEGTHRCQSRNVRQMGETCAK